MDFFKKLSPQRKRLLGVGLVAFVVLLFVSFLLSLLDSDPQQPTQAVDPAQSQGSLQLQQPQMPSSQRYDFNQETPNPSAGLEELLTNDQGIDGNGPAPSYGPAPLPTPEEEAAAQSGQITEELSMPEPEPIPEFVLYCDEYATTQDAESQKAMLAFQGISTSIVESNGKYRLKIGPYSTSELAKTAFNDLGKKGLVKKCSLVAL